MRPWWRRALRSRAFTIAGAVGIGLLGVALPPAAGFTTPIALGLAGWAMRHPADAPRPADEESEVR